MIEGLRYYRDQVGDNVLFCFVLLPLLFCDERSR